MYYWLGLCCLVEFATTTTSDTNRSLHAQLHQLRQIVSEQGHSIELLQDRVHRLTKGKESCADQQASTGDDSTHEVRQRKAIKMFFK